jgi:nitrilase
VGVRERVTVACVQVEPAIFDRSGTIDRVAERTAEAAAAGAQLVVFPETFIPAYPSSVWAKALAGWSEPGAKEAFALLHRESLEIPGADADRLAAIAREHGVWLVVGVNEADPERSGTLFNSLLYYSPEGELALHHRKLVPTNHERLVWGQGDGRGLRAIESPLGRLGGLICWENYMPLARFALYESGVEIYIASTADDGDSWQATLQHIALESRSFVISPCHFQRAGSYPDDFPLNGLLEGRDLLGRRELPRRPAVRRGGDPLRGPRSGRAPAGATAFRSRRPLPPAGRAPADGQPAGVVRTLMRSPTRTRQRRKEPAFTSSAER